jgi:hypothetical protein
LRAKVGLQRENRCVFRRLLRYGQRTGTTLDIDATWIVANLREAQITGKGENGIRRFIIKRTYVQRSIAGLRNEIFSTADEPARTHLKAATAGRTAVTGKAGYQRKVRPPLRRNANHY